MIARDYVRHSRGFVSQYSNFNFDLLYPVGSIYTTIDVNFNPNSAEGWSGTWQRINDGYYLKTIDQSDPDEHCGSYYSTTKTITSSSHQLTINEMPVHSHDYGTLAISPNGEHYHTADSEVSDTGNQGTHIHHSYGSSGAWLAGSTPAVNENMPWYKYKSSKGFDIYNDTDLRTPFYTELTDAGMSASHAREMAGAHTHNIVTTVNTNGLHSHSIGGSTGEEGYGQGHDHSITLTNLKPNYIAVIIWKRVS